MQSHPIKASNRSRYRFCNTAATDKHITYGLLQKDVGGSNTSNFYFITAKIQVHFLQQPIKRYTTGKFVPYQIIFNQTKLTQHLIAQNASDSTRRD
jgi:hypothetical protein